MRLTKLRWLLGVRLILLAWTANLIGKLDIPAGDTGLVASVLSDIFFKRAVNPTTGNSLIDSWFLSMNGILMQENEIRQQLTCETQWLAIYITELLTENYTFAEREHRRFSQVRLVKSVREVDRVSAGQSTSRGHRRFRKRNL
jgi:hypothetical protein